jgi:hypothetical protein
MLVKLASDPINGYFFSNSLNTELSLKVKGVKGIYVAPKESVYCENYGAG